MTSRMKRAALAAVLLLVAAVLYVVAGLTISAAAANALLHPARRPLRQLPPSGCSAVTFPAEGVTLKGWRCPAVGEKRATLVFLHGVGDNRESVAGAVARFTAKGLEVVAYDSRAHGESTGDVCTYGYWEKRDLKDVLDRLSPTFGTRAFILVGTSLGGAVALQEAADDNRVVGVVAAEVFSDLRTVALERAPRFLTSGMIRRAFALAEAEGHFRVDEVAPVKSARRVVVPVLLIHGTNDTDTRADHSRRVLAALAGPKELLLIEGAGHNESLHSTQTWRHIEVWIDEILASEQATEELHPSDGLFSSVVEPDNPYSLAVRSALLGEHPYRKCQMLAVPSFSSEWAVYLVRDANGERRVISKRFRRHLWVEISNALTGEALKTGHSLGVDAWARALNRISVPVDRWAAPISPDIADLLEDVWWRMLGRARYADTETIGLDGVTFHVSHWPGTGGAPRSGTTWSPIPGSRPSALVEIATTMASFAQAPPGPARTQLEADLKARAEALFARLK